MRPARRRLPFPRGTDPSCVAFCPILLLALVAACSKDKDPDRPAKLVAFPETLKIQKVWAEKVGGTKVPLRLGLALDVEGDTVYAAGEKGEIAAFNLQNGHPRRGRPAPSCRWAGRSALATARSSSAPPTAM